MITELVALFGAGVASVFSPCAFALVPAYVGVITGELGAVASKPASKRTPVAPTLLFVAGFTTVFTALGLGAGLLGAAIPGTRRAIGIGGGVVIIVMGLAKLGRVPMLLRERRRIAIPSNIGRNARPYIFGIAFGAGWSPCVGPLLGSALTLGAQSRDPGRAALLLGAYSIGTGLAFVAAALAMAASPRFTRALRSASPRLERAAGIVLVGLGALLVSDAYVHIGSVFARFAPAPRGL